MKNTKKSRFVLSYDSSLKLINKIYEKQIIHNLENYLKSRHMEKDESQNVQNR